MSKAMFLISCRKEKEHRNQNMNPRIDNATNNRTRYNTVAAPTVLII